jgi:enamine deaminase RidA (YjgF/YER057c/UK114 family)
VTEPEQVQNLRLGSTGLGRGRTTVAGVSDSQRISSGLPYELVVGYSRAIRVDDRVFVSGTTPQWADGSVNPDPEAQARRCFEIIEKALMEAGSGLADIVRTRVYLTSTASVAAIEKVHGELFASIRPANTILIVAGLLNPEWKVEVEVDAIVGVRERISTGS